jgi:hypothetical protein
MQSKPEHLPSRPDWRCSSCGRLWPCDPAREHLAQEFAASSTGLAMLLWGHFEDYVIDSGPGPLSEAYERFLGWSRPLRREAG